MLMAWYLPLYLTHMAMQMQHGCHCQAKLRHLQMTQLVVVLPFCAAVVAVVPPFSEVGFGLPEPISLEESDGAGACTVRPAPFVDLVNAGLHPVANALIMASCPARGSKVNLLIRHELVQKKQELQMEGAELSPVILVHVQASTHLPWVAPNALGDRFGKELAVCNTLEAG